MSRRNPSIETAGRWNLSAGSEQGLALAILFVLPVLLFSSTILGDHQFMGHDTLQWRASAESVYDDRAEHGEEPLWSTHLFGGMPAYVVHVAKAVPHLDNKVFDRLRFIWPAIPYWILLGGCYFFFILQGFRPLVSVMGALLIGFTSYLPIILGAGHNAKFIAFSYIPWIASGYWMITRSQNRWWGFFLLAVACTLQFRAGHPQVTYYFLFLFAGLFLYDGWNHYKEGRTQKAGIAAALLTSGVVLGFLGTADSYLRLMEYSPHSIRGGSAIADITGSGGLSLEYAFSWSQGIAETLTLIIPNLFGGDSGLAYWGEKPGTSGPHYFGAVGFLLFLIGLMRSQRRIKFLFLGVGLLTLTFSWGYHFPLNELWFHFLPGFDKFRTPEMWLIVTIFCFAILAVFGLESTLSAIRSSSGKAADGFRQLQLPLIIAFGLGVLLLVGTPMLSYESEREREQIAQQLASQNNLSPDNRQVQQQVTRLIDTRLKPERQDLARNDTLRYLLICAVGIGLIFLAAKSVIGVEMLLLSLILLSSLDLLSADSRYVSDQALVSRQLDLTEVIERSRSPVDSYLQEQVRNPEGYLDRVFPLDDNPFNNAIPNYSYPSIGGYSGAKLSIIQDVIDQGLFIGPQGINLEMLNMLNVRYLTARRDLPLQTFHEIHREGEYRVYENQSVLPKAWFVDEVITVESPLEAFSGILPDSDFRPENTAIVETTGSFDIEEDPDADINITTYSARHIELEISRTTPGFLVLSEVYYAPGWKATLNGEEIPIHKTNYLLRGFDIPEGSHRLSLEFHPDSHRTGVAISWASNLIQWGLGIGLVTGWIKRKRKGI